MATFVIEETHPVTGADTATTNGTGSGSGTTITYAGVDGTIHCIDSVECGYGAAPTGGMLTVTAGSNGTTLVKQIPIINGGAAPISLKMRGFPGKALSVNLADGGNSVAGYLNLNHRTELVGAIKN